VPSLKDRWQQHTAATVDGLLEWTEFPGPRTFVGCTKLAGRPISPVDGNRLLAEIAHPAAQLDYVGGGWGVD